MHINKSIRFFFYFNFFSNFVFLFFKIYGVVVREEVEEEGGEERVRGGMGVIAHSDHMPISVRRSLVLRYT